MLYTLKESDKDKAEGSNGAGALQQKLLESRSIVISGEINADGEVNFSVCRAVFALGENWSDGELERVERELEDLSTNNSM